MLLNDHESVRPWLGRLLEFGLVRSTGKTKGTKYFVAPEILKSLNFPATTSLARIQPHRLDALVFEDLQRFPGSPISDIHGRIGAEIPRHQVKAALVAMAVEKRITHQGKNRWRRYTVVSVAIEKTS